MAWDLVSFCLVRVELLEPAFAGWVPRLVGDCSRLVLERCRGHSLCILFYRNTPFG